MMVKIHDIYTILKGKKNKYLTDQVIKEYLCFVCNFEDFTTLFLHFDDEIDFDFEDKRLLDICDGIPYQYVLGYQYFCGHKFVVDKGVLIPRQETEELVNLLQAKIVQKFGNKETSLLDIGCGSGCIGISLKLAIDELDVELSDISPLAILISKKNAQLLDANVNVYLSDLFDDIPQKKYQVIVSNPPYIENEKNVDKQTMKYEPHIALFARPAHKFYEAIIKNSINYLDKEFLIAFEIEENMEEKMTSLINQYLPSSHFDFYKDICGKTRFVIISNGDSDE